MFNQSALRIGLICTSALWSAAIFGQSVQSGAQHTSNSLAQVNPDTREGKLDFSGGACAPYDFEEDDGGLIGDGDWEWGTDFSWSGGGCDGVSYPPPGAYSGTGMWATKLNDCYANSSSFSSLSLLANLSDLEAAILEWWDWYDVFEPFDFSEVLVNDVVVFERAAAYFIPTSWQFHQIDLTPYVGGPVDIEFRTFATSVVNRAGWYIDNLLIGAPSCSMEAIFKDRFESGGRFSVAEDAAIVQ